VVAERLKIAQLLTQQHSRWCEYAASKIHRSMATWRNHNYRCQQVEN
jgi:hypothetical protein